MSGLLEQLDAHPEGEHEKVSLSSFEAWPLDTPGGRFYAEWDEDAPVSRDGQLIFFLQFLKAGGRWEQFMEKCPLFYTGNRGSGALNVMGTVLLSVLNGHWRYAHINAVRGDGINPPLLGMKKTVSEDAVRAAMKRIPEAAGLEWLHKEIRDSIEPALELPWILDIDTTVKTLYGHQEGAQISYNPHKPGRPSHIYHSYFVSNLRISLGVDVLPGKKHSAGEGMPGLWEMLDALPRSRWPTFGRGDCGYGSEKVMREFEEHDLPYLFKQRHTPKVKELVKTCMSEGSAWIDTGSGWEAMESELKLSGWTQTRRVVLVREAPALAPVGNQSRRRRDHQSLPGTTGEGWENTAAPWSGKIAVLVTSLDPRNYPTEAMPRLYRERADCENVFDELKNQWGWNGFTTQKLAPCRLMANLVALIYNWWNLYVRFYDEEHHREAITSRPALMQGVARQVQSGGQRKVKVSILHEKGDIIARAVTLISSQLHAMMRIAEQWTIAQRWAFLLTRLLRGWLGGKWLRGVPIEAEPLLSG
tara:strand:- start:107 stop:1696 length:1590 start_codon:yes stop_codon:yes gene_type:complete